MSDIKRFMWSTCAVKSLVKYDTDTVKQGKAARQYEVIHNEV